MYSTIPANSLRILIADDHDVVRRGLHALISAHPGWVVCGEAGDGREAVEKARQLRPDVLVVDIMMPNLNGIDAARQILQELPQTKVLILTMHKSQQLAEQSLAIGALAYLNKSDLSQDLITVIESLTRRQPGMNPRLPGSLQQAGMAHRQMHRLARNRLTPRQREIVQLLAEGKSNKQVATALGISVKTVETHRSNTMRKLELHSVSDLVHYAIQNKIVEP